MSIKEESTAEAITRLAEAIIAQGPKGPLEMTGFTKEQQHRLTEPVTPNRWRMIPGKSPDTDATFDMLVVESKSKHFPNGRITQLHNYKHPTGMFRSRSNGGRVPDGFPIFVSGDRPMGGEDEDNVARSQLTDFYRQWKYDNFYKRDLLMILGHGEPTEGGLKAAYCREPDGMKTPWQAGLLVAADAAE